MAHEQQVHETKIKIQSVIALAFVPAGENLYNYFCYLMQQFPPDDQEIHRNYHYRHLSVIIFNLEFIKYFIKNWIGCQFVMGLEPVGLEEGEEYGAQIDANIRYWIRNNGLNNREARFPMGLWNMCER